MIIYEIIKKGPLRKFFLDKAIRLHTFSYKAVKKLICAPGELHPKHRIINYNKFFIENVDSGDVILDVGCYCGETCFALAPRVKKALGIDIDNSKVEDARKKSNFTNVEFIHGDATTYDFSEINVNKFDKVILSNVLEHIKEREEFLKKMRRITDTILLRVPMLDRDWLVVYKKEKGYEYRLDPTHEIEFTERQLDTELSEGGWKIAKKKRIFGEAWAVLNKK